MYRLIVLIFAFSFTPADAKFPNNPKPCAYGDTSCITELVNFLLSEKSGGYSSLNLINIDPLQIAAIDIKQGKESPVNIDLRFRNSELVGLRDCKVKQIKGFGKDLTQRHEIILKCPFVSLIGDYKISGKVLILPVQGTGKSNITLINTDLGIYFAGSPQVKADGTYLTIKNMRISVEPKRVYFDLTNLFNGDKTLGDNLNFFLNENWEDIFREVKASINEAYSKVFESVINNVFQKYPYEKLFV